MASIASTTGDGLARLWQPLGLPGLQALATRPEDPAELARAAAGRTWLPGREHESRLWIVQDLAAGLPAAGLLDKMAGDLDQDELVTGLTGLGEGGNELQVAHRVLSTREEPRRWAELGRHVPLPPDWRGWVQLAQGAEERGTLLYSALGEAARGSEDRFEATARALERINPSEPTSRRLLAALPGIDGYRQAVQPGFLQTWLGDPPGADEALLGGLAAGAPPDSRAARLASRRLERGDVIEKALEHAARSDDGARSGYLKALVVAGRVEAEWRAALKVGCQAVPDDLGGMLERIESVLPLVEPTRAHLRAARAITQHLAGAVSTPTEREFLRVIGRLSELKPERAARALNHAPLAQGAAASLAQISRQALSADGSGQVAYPFGPGEHSLALDLLKSIETVARLEGETQHAALAGLLLDLDRERTRLSSPSDLGKILRSPVQSAKNLVGVDGMLAHGLSALAAPELDPLEFGQSLVTEARADFGDRGSRQVGLLFARALARSAPPALAAQAGLIPALDKLTRGADLVGDAILSLDPQATDPEAARAALAGRGVRSLYEEGRPQAAERLVGHVLDGQPFLQQLLRAPVASRSARQAMHLEVIDRLAGAGSAERDPGWLAGVAADAIARLEERDLRQLAPVLLDGLVEAAAEASETEVFPGRVEACRTALAGGQPASQALGDLLGELRGYQGEKLKLLVAAQSLSGASVESVGETEQAVFVGGVRIKKR